MNTYEVSEYEFSALINRKECITNQLNNDIANGDNDLIEESQLLLNDITAIISKAGSVGSLVDEETHNLITSHVEAHERDVAVKFWLQKLKDITTEDILKSFGINI